MMPSSPVSDTLFLDLEVIPDGPDAGKVFRWAALQGEELYQGKDVMGLFERFRQSSFLCAHNLLAHDARYLPKHPETDSWLAPGQHAIDTLYLSTLLFAEHPYHRLSKDYRQSSLDANDPAEDVRNLRLLFWNCVEAWQGLPEKIKVVYRSLLAEAPEFSGFLSWVRGGRPLVGQDLVDWIQEVFRERICSQITCLDALIETQPVALAYAFALIQTRGLPSIHPAWLLQRYPALQGLLRTLRGQPCASRDCGWCRSRLEPQVGLEAHFGYTAFRSYAGVDLQAQIVRASLAGESLLAILPTGGGKSLTFQLPALMQGEALRALTVVISPLQSLMKDQVDSLSDKFDIEGAVTLNGALTASDRKLAIDAIESGKASLLYLSPEALRSNTVLRLLKARSIARFVIDEAHCFSEWGQDFRVDYLYLARFMQHLQRLKGLNEPIPVSCFTATAKQAVQTDILGYFKDRLGLDLKLFSTRAQRTNLNYRVFSVLPEQKYVQLRILLSERSGRPKIVYASTTRTVEELAAKLQRDGIGALPFHGRMERLAKLANMEAFMRGEVEVMVATSAFGMGVDKDNVEMVIHYEICDSLEDYLQEAGRAGRKAELQADCCILFDENDLERHFQLLNAQRLNRKEINQIWDALKKLKLASFSRSTLEIARDAGWDLEQQHLETRVKSALAALEEAGLLQRHQNDTLVLAGYFTTCAVEHANRVIADSPLFAAEAESLTAKRIFQYLLSRASTQEKQDLQFDWMCEHLGLDAEAAHRALNGLRQEGLIHSQSRQHVTLFSAKRGDTRTRFRMLAALERRLAELLDYEDDGILPTIRPLSLKEVNHLFKQEGLVSSLEDLRLILRHAWGSDFVTRRAFGNRKKEEFVLSFHKSCKLWRESIERRLKRCERLFEFLEELKPEADAPRGIRRVAFPLPVLKAALESQLFDTEAVSLHDCDQLLLKLHLLRALQAEDGVALYYTRMRFTRAEETANRIFTIAHYARLKSFYDHKVQQIHIVGSYARRMLSNPADAQSFSADYFQLDFKEFLKKHFRGQQDVILRPMTERRWQHIFGELSEQQKEIIQDDKHQRMLVAAGPGSGKTRILVHKVAALLLLEEVKPEQFLMLTFSRPAAQEVRTRLVDLIGNVAWRLDIATFHSYAFQLLEQPGEQENLKDIVERARLAIEADELPNRARIASKSVILVDEYQDISQREYAFLSAIIQVASESDPPRVIVVGDDDQNIYEFRGSSTRFMRDFSKDFDSRTYYLGTNFRSAPNLVRFSNRFAEGLQERIKAGIELKAARATDGELSLTRYRQPDFYLPLVQQIASQCRVGAAGSRAVLCATNEEALLLESLLRQQGLPARLLMQLDHFQLRNLLELQLFSQHLLTYADPAHGLITSAQWQASQDKVHRQCRGSQALALLDQMLADFRAGHDKLYYGDWESWLGEIRWEDVYDCAEQGTILVSTMHKAKGKEFDQVWLYLDHFNLRGEADRRAVYVALTRARHGLYIHTRHDCFDRLSDLARFETWQTPYSPPRELILQLSLKDIWLGHAIGQQGALAQAVSGMALQPEPDGSLRQIETGARIKVSQVFQERQKKLQNRGYRPTRAEIGYIVLWFDKRERKSYRIALPRIHWRSDTGPEGVSPE